MPSTQPTPAQLAWSGGSVTIEPVRVDVTAASLSWTGGFALIGPGTGTSLSVTVPNLSRLTQFDKLFNPDGTPSARMVGIWQAAMGQIEAAFTALSTQVADNAALLAEIQAAQALATAANDNATEASDTLSINNSYVTGNILTADNGGNITIAAHTRYYGNGDSVSVNAGALSGFASGDYVTVYYKDAAREGGAVTYAGTTSAVAQKGDTHVVGQATIPASGSPPSSGTSTSAPGYTPPSGSETFDPDYVEP